MTLRIKLGNFVVEGDTEDELRAAMRVMGHEEITADTIKDSVKSTPVGPTDTVRGELVTMPPEAGETIVTGAPEVVPSGVFKRQTDLAALNVLTLAPSPPTMIPVRRVLLDVLDVLLTFPEGITGKGVSQLTGVNPSAVSHRLTRLKRQGLAEGVKGTINWRATALARKAKLVSS